ncbi:DUF441 domain-containing protein [Salsuginibacillus kocurii]|uniref:DUF441 domain-containing protein n=1 Tax=Salsuginibacillus kocurii TaxID=427078 RepID=UPI000381A378|nr:DUF441 domain-containing protein [Salsuginibacillus kocurii]
MFTQPTYFLLILLAIGLIGKNQTLIAAIAILLILKWVGLGDRVFPFMEERGIQIGVTVLTIAVLIPIVTGEIGFKELQEAVRSSYAWIALGAGIAVALIARGGVELLQNDPHITAALIIGTILAVAFFNGVAVGPLIGAGIAWVIMKIVEAVSSIGV